MVKKCVHIYGIWDCESSVIGRCIFVTSKQSELYGDRDFEKFNYCPLCGANLNESSSEW